MTAAALRAKPAAGQAPGGDALAAWAERAGRRQAAEHGRGQVRFVFYGRVSFTRAVHSGMMMGADGGSMDTMVTHPAPGLAMATNARA